MRLDKMFLKMFQVEPRVPIRLLLDISKSMAATEEKFLFARRLAAALCYVGLVRLDSMDIIPFASRILEGKSAGGGRHRYRPVGTYLEGLQAEGATDFPGVVRQFLNEYPQRGLVIIISDFLDDGSCAKALQYVADYGNEIMLIQLWADQDRIPPWQGEVEMVDAESGEKLRIQVDEAARAKYTEGFDRFSAELREIAIRNQGKYAGIPTSMPLDDAIFGELIRARSIA